MKKVGIVVDNYKVDKFKKELTKKGFTDFEVKSWVHDCSNIRVNVEDSDVKEVEKICRKCELYFSMSKNKN